jgi:hypothetical protein
MSISEAVMIFKVPRQTVSYIVKKYEESESKQKNRRMEIESNLGCLEERNNL